MPPDATTLYTQALKTQLHASRLTRKALEFTLEVALVPSNALEAGIMGNPLVT